MSERRFKDLERRMRRLERMQGAPRPAIQNRERNTRLAKTFADSVTYPTSGDLFPIIFLDGEFDQFEGGDTDYSDRAETEQAWVKVVSGEYIHEGEERWVFRDSGKGEKGKGEYWTYRGKFDLVIWIWATAISAASAGAGGSPSDVTPGSGTVDLYIRDRNSPNKLILLESDVTIYSWVFTASPTERFGFATMDGAGDLWWTNLGC